MNNTPTEAELRPLLDQSYKLAGRPYTIVSIEAFDPTHLYSVPNEMPPELFDWLAAVWEVTAVCTSEYGHEFKETVVVGRPREELHLVHSFREKEPLAGVEV